MICFSIIRSIFERELILIPTDGKISDIAGMRMIPEVQKNMMTRSPWVPIIWKQIALIHDMNV